MGDLTSVNGTDEQSMICSNLTRNVFLHAAICFDFQLAVQTSMFSHSLCFVGMNAMQMRLLN